MSATEGYAAPDPVPMLRRALRRLFPHQQRPDIPHLHGVTSTVHARLDLADRIRTLISGHVVVTVSVDTEFEPGSVLASRASVSVRAPGEVA